MWSVNIYLIVHLYITLIILIDIPSAGSILEGTANSERHLPSRIELRISSVSILRFQVLKAFFLNQCDNEFFSNQVQPSSFKMRDSRLRLKTFQDNKSVWENSYKHKTISDQEFVDAGFFCLGKITVVQTFLG